MPISDGMESRGAPGVNRRHAVPRDVPAAIVLAALCAVAAGAARFHAAPMEDAAMLMRYAQHLAAGHGLVWNVGEKPVDGATDFLLTVAAGGVAALGVPVVAAVRLIGLASWVATVAVVYLTARRQHGVEVPAAVLAAAAIALGVAPLHVAAGFGTPFFGLWVATTTLLALRAGAGDTRPVVGLLFGSSWLLLGLTRPEGVLLGGFLLVMVVLRRGSWTRVRPFVTSALAVMALLGGTYFVWRWNYFGHPLPNPFYKKGGATLHVDGLLVSVRSSAIFLVPSAVVWVSALVDRDERRAAWIALTPIALFTFSWVLLSPEMNYAARFQYPILVMAAMLWPAFVGASPIRRLGRLVGRRGSGNRRVVAVAAGVSAVVLAAAPTVLYAVKGADAGTDDRAVVGELMAPYADRGYLVATTEAGLIPLLSGWRALDTWGLNDQTIAHRGFLTEDDLDAARPTVIFAHLPSAPGEAARPDPVLGQRWTDMGSTLTEWARRHGYQHVRSAGHLGGGSWNIWVVPDAPDSAELADRLRCHTYRDGWIDLLGDTVIC